MARQAVDIGADAIIGMRYDATEFHRERPKCSRMGRQSPSSTVKLTPFSVRASG